MRPTDVMAAAGLVAGMVSVLVSWRQSFVRRRDVRRLKEDMDGRHGECLKEIARLDAERETSQRNAQSSLELLRDGRLGMPARARALQMLRSGMAADTAAAELGLARNEVQLLAKVAALLALRN